MGRKITSYKTDFVEYIPERLEPGILYISVKYNIATHLCACGCGEEIVTPINRNSGWILTYDGENVSLSPSIGNGGYKCRSHYFLKQGKIEWLPNFGQNNFEEITQRKTWIVKIMTLVKRKWSE